MRADLYGLCANLNSSSSILVTIMQFCPKVTDDIHLSTATPSPLSNGAFPQRVNTLDNQSRQLPLPWDWRTLC